MMKFLICNVLVLASLGIGGCESTPTPPSPSAHADSLGRGVPSWVNNDADLLLYRCGASDIVLDTSNDDPRPLIPSRLVTYRKAHLKFFYVPHDPVNQPPPYHWKLMGMSDTRTNKVIAPNEMQSILQQRLPCMLKNPD
jgi:hypothetical protein